MSTGSFQVECASSTAISIDAEHSPAPTPSLGRDGVGAGECSASIEMAVDEAHSTWNEPVDMTRFVVSVPPGRQVFDEQQKSLYVSGKTNPGTNLKDLV